MVENPNRKNKVWYMPRLRMTFLSFLSSSIDIPVIYDKNAGYNGSVQGEIKLKNPAPNARNKLISLATIVTLSLCSPYLTKFVFT